LVVRAWSLPADCVVVGHHGQGPLEESLLGNMTQHLLHHTTCDALIVP
jgi:nucleotide-binding universal stress UspA family protein